MADGLWKSANQKVRDDQVVSLETQIDRSLVEEITARINDYIIAEFSAAAVRVIDYVRSFVDCTADQVGQVLKVLLGRHNDRRRGMIEASERELLLFS